MKRADWDIQEPTEPEGAASDQCKLSVKEQLLLQLLQHTSIRQKDLADKISKTAADISGPLAELKAAGYIENVDPPQGGKKGKYWTLITKNEVLLKLFHDKMYPAVATGMRSSDLVAEPGLGVFPDVPNDIKTVLKKMIRLSPDFFAVILKNPSFDQLSHVCSPYLVSSSFSEQTVLKTRPYFMFHQLFAESLIREGKSTDEKGEYVKLLGELNTALLKYYTYRTDLQKNKEIIDTIEKTILVWKKESIDDREKLVANCSHFQQNYELIDKKNDPDQEIKR
ncbi:MAG: hypothetical protein NTW33_02655, partial [Methanoregula sp.]|nr:hypothetical protein [Methanoregula sp.]